MNLGRQNASQDVKGMVDILKISAIYLRYFQYFIEISPILIDILTEISVHALVRYTFDILMKYRHFMIFR